MSIRVYVLIILIFSGLVLMLPTGAPAYMGPTLGLGIVGTVIAVVVVLLLSLFAFVFVPIRRMLRKTRQKSLDKDSDS